MESLPVIRMNKRDKPKTKIFERKISGVYSRCMLTRNISIYPYYKRREKHKGNLGKNIALDIETNV